MIDDYGLVVMMKHEPFQLGSKFMDFISQGSLGQGDAVTLRSLAPGRADGRIIGHGQCGGGGIA